MFLVVVFYPHLIVNLTFVKKKTKEKMFRTTYDEREKLWYGPQIKMKWTKESSLGSKILSSLRLYGPNIAQVTIELNYNTKKTIRNFIIIIFLMKICAVTGETKTFDDLYRLTVRAVINMEKFGCKRGRRIFLLSDNVTDLAPLTFAAMCLSCPLVPLVTKSTKDECEYFINVTKPEFAICELKYYTMLKECFTNLKIDAKIFTIGGQVDDSIATECLFEDVDNESEFK